jgi:homoserine dehydrogenase
MKQGIQEIAPEDLESAGSMGYRVKHLGIARRTDQGVEMRVHPTLIPEHKQIATVDGVLNAVMISGDAVGEVVLVGPGAGGAATASSVCADLVDVARNPAGSGPALGIAAAALQAPNWVPVGDIASEWYVRITASDQSGVMSDITQILASRDISIESIIQKPQASGSDKVPVVLLTHVAPQSVMTDALNEIMALEEVDADAALMRVEAFDG